MEGLLQPTHLFFILLIVLILFGPGKLPKVGEGFRKATEDLRSLPHRGALFMAKGVDPAVGRDVGDMLPDEEARWNEMRFRCLLAILGGNTLYFASLPLLPEVARPDGASSPGLPALVDLWFCLFVFGVLNLVALVRRRNRPKK